VVDELVERGHRAIVVDDHSTCWLDEGEEPKFRNPQHSVTYVRADVNHAHFQVERFGEVEAVIHLACRHPVERERALYRVAWSGYVNGGVDLLLNLVNAGAPVKRFVTLGTTSEPSSFTTRAKVQIHEVMDHALRIALDYWHRPPNLGVYHLLAPELVGVRRLPEAEVPVDAETAPVEGAAKKLVDLADGTERHKHFPGVGLGPARFDARGLE